MNSGGWWKDDMRQLSTALAVAALGLTIATHAVEASASSPIVVPPGRIMGNVSAYTNPYTASFSNPMGGSVQLSGNYSGFNSSSLVAGSTDQIIRAEAHSFVQSGRAISLGATADGFLGYQIVVYGPSSILVPIHLSGALNVSVNSSGFAGARATADYHLSGYSAFDSGDTALSVTCSSSNGGADFGQCGGVVFNSNFEATAFSASGTGHAISIGLNVSANASSNGFFVGDPGFDALDRTGDAYATADPYAEIDPAWLQAHPGYALAFSSGFTNGAGPAVPEPTTWALMLGGFGLAGSGLRRRRALASTVRA